MTLLPQGVKETMHVEIQGLYWVRAAPHWPPGQLALLLARELQQESCPHSPWERAHLLTPHPQPHSSHPTPQVWVSCPWWYRSEICLCPSPKGAAPVASISSSATIQTHIPGLGLSTHISVPSITSWSCRIIASVSWWLRAIAKYQIYPRGVSMRAQWWWWDRGLEPHNYS